MDDDGERRQLQPVGDVLDLVLARFAGPSPVARSALFEQWDSIAGATWRGTRPIELDPRQVLVVEVADGAAASKLRFETSRLVDRIEESLGSRIVASVRLRVRRTGR